MLLDIVGTTMIATPFVAILILMTKALGIKPAILGFFIVVAVVALTAVGIFMLTYELPAPPIVWPTLSLKNG